MNDVELWFREALTPPPVLTVSEWADENRVLSRKASSEAGKWRTDRTPYLREIMDCLSAFHPAKKVVFKKSSQVGGTECGNNWLGYIIAHAPAPAMLIFPTLDLAKRNSKLRIDTLIEESPAVKAKVSDSRSRDSSNTIWQKDFDNGTLVMAGANSAASLKSTACRFVMLDEYEEYGNIDVQGQGSPMELVEARQRTFSRRKSYIVSTPIEEGNSAIDVEYENSDQRSYHVPCPHCGHFQTLEIDRLTYDSGNPINAKYRCIDCEELIEERFKTKMLLQGKWIAANPGHETAGFFINSLYSPLGWFSWTDIAKAYEKAKKDLEQYKRHDKMKTFTNTMLGLSYGALGEAPEWKKLYQRRLNYKIGLVPVKSLFLTAGVDIQKDRIEVEVVAWCERKISYSVEKEIIQGDTSKDEVWDELEEYLGKTFEGPEAEHYTLKQVAIDSGYLTTTVYNFCRRFPGNRVVPVKGNENLSIIVAAPKAVDVKMKNKRRIRRAVKVYSVGVSVLKTELYNWLNLELPMDPDAPVPTGYCFFPEYEQEHFEQLTAEKKVLSLDRRGFNKYEYVKMRERNEALDLRVYARAAASMAGLDRRKVPPADEIPVEGKTARSENATKKVAQPQKVADTENKPTQDIKKFKKPKPKRDSSYWP